MKKENRKRKGFTLIELIAVMAILAILAAAMTPKVIGYINDGKKTNAVEEARQVILAVESFNVSTLNASDKIEDSDEFKDFKGDISAKDYIDLADLKYIDESNTYGQLK